MPLCPQITNTPITVTQTADFTVTNVLPLVPLQTSTDTIVNASNQLTAINGSGITVYSGASATTGARVVLNSAGLAGFDSSSTGPSTGNTFSISASTGAATFVGTVTATAGAIAGFTIAGSGSSSYLYSGNLTLYANGNIDGGSSGTLFYPKVNVGGGTPSGAAFQVLGASELTGNLTVTGTGLFQGADNSFPNITTSTSAANVRWGTTTNGRLFQVVASSARFKDNIVPLNSVYELKADRLLDLPVRAFTYKPEYLSEGDERAEIMVPGFITEEMDEIYPIAVDYENGVAHNWNEKFIIPALVSLVQDLYKRVEELEKK